jgi:hypothetical protein
MISPHTPPGTEVVAVMGCAAPFGCPWLVKGWLYTVDHIERAPRPGEYGVVLVEHGVFYPPPERRPWWLSWLPPKRQPHGWRLEAFRYVDLAGLDALLEAPAPKKRARVREKAR